MKATRPARLLSWTVDAFDRFWGPLLLVVIIALEVFVFAPREMPEAMIGGGIVGSAVFVAWLLGGSL
jgi:hypothetical protein